VPDFGMWERPRRRVAGAALAWARPCSDTCMEGPHPGVPRAAVGAAPAPVACGRDRDPGGCRHPQCSPAEVACRAQELHWPPHPALPAAARWLL
jgi:hypothetical protein